MKYKHHYLINFQYLGFRFHGFQKQADIKTVHFLMDRTLNFLYKDIRFKSLGVGRTDAKVSASDYYFQFFIDEALDEEKFINDFNINCPSDMRVIACKKMTNNTFNIIQNPKIKEYRYYFSFGEKNHPYAAPFLAGVLEELDIELMKIGAKLFEGEHDFTNYCTKPSPETKVIRSVLSCEIKDNEDFNASFFPEKSYVLIVRSDGFLRNQIRLMMGTLFELGNGNYDLDFIKQTLSTNCNELSYVKRKAPASGLHLHHIDFIGLDKL